MRNSMKKWMTLGLAGIMIFGTVIPVMAQEQTEVSQENKELQWVIKPRFEAIGGISEDGAVIVKEQGKWGLISVDSKWLVTPQYSEIRDFSEGLAAVKKDGMWGFIDSKGKLIIPCQYEAVTDFSDGLASYGYEDSYSEKEKMMLIPIGIIDQKGKLIFDLAAYNAQNECLVYQFYGFSEGVGVLIILRESGEQSACCIDRTGKVILQSNYADIGDLTDGLAWAVYCEESEESIRANYEKDPNYYPEYKIAYIDAKGKRVLDDLPYESVWSFSEGLARVGNKQYKMGCIDQKGKLVIPCIYDELRPVQEGMIGFSKDGLMGFLDMEGKVVIAPQYDQISVFSNHVALSRKSGEKKIQLIDQKGNVLIEGQEDMGIDGEYIFIRQDNKWGIIKNPLIETEKRSNFG